MTEQLREFSHTDCLRRVWDTIRREQLHVKYSKRSFPVISGNPALPQTLMARAQVHFETNTKKDDPYWNCIGPFVRYALAGGGAQISSQICIFMRRHGDEYTVEVETCIHYDSHVQYESILIDIPAGTPLLAEVAGAAGLPDDFEQSWDGSDMFIYPQFRDEGEQTEEESEIEARMLTKIQPNLTRESVRSRKKMCTRRQMRETSFNAAGEEREKQRVVTQDGVVVMSFSRI